MLCPSAVSTSDGAGINYYHVPYPNVASGWWSTRQASTWHYPYCWSARSEMPKVFGSSWMSRCPTTTEGALRARAQPRRQHQRSKNLSWGCIATHALSAEAIGPKEPGSWGSSHPGCARHDLPMRAFWRTLHIPFTPMFMMIVAACEGS